MPARQCAATEEAMRLKASGLSIRAAAKAAGVAPSTLVRALARLEATKQPKEKK
jgi:lambda repressor-like predicted transcriptional regulator